MRVTATLILVILSSLVFGQGTRLDSLTRALNRHAQSDTIRVGILLEISDYYRWLDFCTAQKYAEDALQISGTLKFERGIAGANNRIAHCYWALGDNGLAIAKGLEAVAISERRGFNRLLGESYQVLARSYLDQREKQKAEFYVGRAAQLALQEKDWDLLSRAYNFSGVVQFIKNNKDSALLLYTQALQIMNEHPTLRAHLSQVTSNIGECYLPNDRTKGLNYLHDALRISRLPETRNKSAEASISSIIGRALVENGEYHEAESYLIAALGLSRELGLKRSIRYAYSGLVNLKIREGKAAEALEYLKKYYEVHDSILNVAKTRQIVELESKYELEKKELAIQLLERDHKIQVLWRNILIATLLLTSAFTLAIYYLQTYRNVKNREILNLQIDKLTNQHKELSEKFKYSLGGEDNIEIESVDQRLLKSAIEVVENNMGDSLFGVEQMARELGMSRTNLNRKIKAITGFPPSELIRSIRLRKAAALLLNQADSVSQIGFKVGFEDHSYFTKSFKKQFGVTPSEYHRSRQQTV